MAIGLTMAVAASAGCLIEDSEPELAGQEQAISGGHASPSFAGSVMITVPLFGNLCTATVLSEHWLLTAAHCVGNGGPLGDIEVSAAFNTAGAPARIYGGPAEAFGHPSWAWNAPHHDIALVHLGHYGLDTAVIGRAKLYADPYKRPWVDGSLGFATLVGFGGFTGADGQECSGPAGQALRWGNERTVFRSATTVGLAHNRFCSGDSGGPWLFGVPAGPSVSYLQFSIISSYDGPLLLDSLDWIENTMRQRAPNNFETIRDGGNANGHAYRWFRERAPGNVLFGPLHNDGGWCVAPADGTVGSQIVLARCDGGWDQLWWMTPTGELRWSLSNLCMSTDWASNGDALRLQPCFGPLTAATAYTQWGLAELQKQRFRHDASGLLHLGLNYRQCLDIPNNVEHEGAPLQAYACNGTPAQIWRM